MFDLKDIIFSAVCDKISPELIREAIEAHIDSMDFTDEVIESVQNSYVVENTISEAIDEVIDSYLN